MTETYKKETYEEVMEKFDVLDEPMTKEQILANVDENCRVSGNICVHISDIIDNDYESFLDYIAEELVDDDTLMNIDYDVVGAAPENNIILKVSGDISMMLERWREESEEMSML